jgi:hypothetical protein
MSVPVNLTEYLPEIRIPNTAYSPGFNVYSREYMLEGLNLLVSGFRYAHRS